MEKTGGGRTKNHQTVSAVSIPTKPTNFPPKQKKKKKDPQKTTPAV
jgi:hypothetical protein